MDSFGKYAVVTRLGVGGMAELYKCRLTGPGGFDKFVAVKRVLPERAEEPEFINMFLDEARLAANLSHPNIVQIFEVDDIDGVPYIAMEFVGGPTFRKLTREASKQSNIHLGHLAKIMSDVCEGLHYAHHATTLDGEPMHLVHRDVSPQNILVTLGGVPKLLDFGVAKAEGRLAATQVGTIKGKLKYMAPEQLRGEAIDHRADVFSAGVCLYEATTGELPFAAPAASELELLQSVLRGSYRKPSEVVPGYPPALEQAVLSAIEPDLAKRFPTARDFHEALEGFLSSGEYASSTLKVSAWMKQLLPVVEDRNETRSGIKTPVTPHLRTPRSAALAKPGVPPPPPVEELGDMDFQIVTEVSTRRHRPLLAGAVVVGVALVVGAYWLGRRTSLPAGAPPLARILSAPPASAPPPVSKDEAAVAYLNEAERDTQERRYGLAKDLLAKARTLKVDSPAINIRLATLNDEVEVGEMVFSARGLMDTGQAAQALELIHQALDRSPENVTALELLARARLQAGVAELARRPTASSPGGRSRVQVGTINVSSDPVGGVVFMDDELMGRTPLVLKSVKAGSHQLKVRLRGFLPVQREISVRAGRGVTLAVALTAEAPPRLTSGGLVPEPR